MKVAIAICLLVAVGSAFAGVVVPSATLVRTPSLDSASIQYDRQGGNFFYETKEGHAYASVSPVVQRVVAPVGVSYTAQQVNLGYAPAAIPSIYPNYWGSVVAQPGLYPGQIWADSIYANPIAPIAAAPVAPIASVPSAPVAPVAPVAGIANPTPISSDSVIRDEDTISIESA